MKYLKSLFNNFIEFVLILYQRRFLILEMAKNDISKKYIGSYLGFFWTFINPLVMIFILWVVFSIGFRSAPARNVPFVVWLTAALCVWNAFSEIINTSTNSISNHPNFVKKMLFPLSILPVVKLVAVFITHSIFLVILLIFILLYGLPFSFYWFQFIYYFGAMCILALGLSWITSSLNVFLKDTSQVVGIILQFGFWATPILWDIEIMPQHVQNIVKYNPLYYITQGYRDSFLYFVPFWHNWQMGIYYWLVTGFVFVSGAIIFVRLRPHFADVL
jgi:lipopolysaccharide transport system permease protein